MLHQHQQFFKIKKKLETHFECNARRERCDMQLTDQSVSPCSLQMVMEKRP